MGLLRKMFIASTAGMGGAVVRPNSKKERTAKAAKKQVKVQQEILRELKKR